MRTSLLSPLFAGVAPAAHAAAWSDDSGWLTWIVIGALALFVVGVGVRMFIAARFPKGYRQWAASRRDTFDERNEAWDRKDEEFRR